MRLEGYDDDILDEEEVIDEFMGENARARELRLMRGALEQRQAMFRRDYERGGQDERAKMALRSKLTELDTQIKAIRQEEEIAAFVEGSVRLTLRNSPVEGLDY